MSIDLSTVNDLQFINSDANSGDLETETEKQSENILFNVDLQAKGEELENWRRHNIYQLGGCIP